MHEQTGGLGPDPLIATAHRPLLELLKTGYGSPLTGFRDAPGQKTMVRKELFPEERYAKPFLHVALDGLEVGDSRRG